MKYPHAKVTNLVLFLIFFFQLSSCSKDSDLLTEYVVTDATDNIAIENLVVDDIFETRPNTSIILDVLSNDSYTNSDNVKIVETSTPVNGEVVIIENQTLLYIPASESDTGEETPAEEQEDAVEETHTEEETDTFTYTTEVVNEDESVDSQTGTVTINFSENGQDLSDLKTVAQFKNDFDESWESIEKARYLELSLSGNGGDIYYLDGMQALVAIFQATGDTKYVDDAIELTKNLISTAKPSNTLELNGDHNDNYLSWVSDSRTSITGQGLSNGGQASLHETRGFQHVAKFLWVMHESPNLRANGYQSDYQTILDFMETHIWDKWFSRNDAEAFSSAVDKSSAWAKIGFYLHKATGKPKYRVMFDRFNTDMNYVTASRSMREILEPNTANSSAYQWPRLWSGAYYEGSSVSDLNHANRAVSILVDANEFNDFWTDDDMTKLVNTWNVFWPSGDGSIMKKYIDGTGGDAAGYVEPGWIKLGRFDTALQARLEGRSLHNAAYNVLVCLNHAELAYNRAYMEGSLKYPENQWMD